MLFHIIDTVAFDFSAKVLYFFDICAVCEQFILFFA